MATAVDDPPLTVKKKPKFFSLAWWGLLFTALCVWKYGPRDWAVWNLSSWMTLTQVFCLAAVYEFLQVKAPWVITGASTTLEVLKGITLKVTAVAVAIWNVVTP